MNNARAHSAGLLAFLKGLFAVRLRLILPLAAAAALLVVLSAVPAQAQDEPRAPSRLSARIVEAGVLLRWSPPAEDVDSVEGYEILRRRPNRGESTFTTLVADTESKETTYTDTTATEAGVRYTYRVMAIRNEVRSPRSQWATVLLPPWLVSNIGQSPSATATITQQYAMGFRLGTHGQGYEISSVWIDLAAVPSDLTVSLWIGSRSGDAYSGVAQRKLFDFTNPASFEVGLNQFTAPAGAFAYQNVSHFIVLSGYSSLSIKETTSDDEDPRGEPGALINDTALVRALGSTRSWVQHLNEDDVEIVAAPTSRGSVLRLAIEGSRRESGILASNYTQVQDRVETVSLGDEGGFTISLGAADRYLIRGFSWNAHENSPTKPGLTNPFNLLDGTTTLFSLPRTDVTPGIHAYAAPQGATVAGGKTYKLNYTGSPRTGGVFTQYLGTNSDAEDTPTAPGVTLANNSYGSLDDVALMAVLGEPLHAMVSNLLWANSAYVTVGAADSKVLVQQFTTGPSPSSHDFRLQGIGVNIEGSDDSDGNAQIPDGPSSVSVAVHADSNGNPGAKLFELVSPDEFAEGHSFFEAPPGTLLSPKTTYHMVWSHLSGTHHRLQLTSSARTDLAALTGFSIGDTVDQGADINNLTKVTGLLNLKIALYGDSGPLLEYQVTKDWLHIPDDVEVGDRFRVVFVTFERRDAMSADIEDYNALVQWQAAREENDRIIKGIAADFKAVVCTATVDARANTQMGASQGVPVHWLDGGWDDHPTLIAKSYDEFYGAEWVNEEIGAWVWGNSAHFVAHAPIWTGCDAAGVAHPVAHMGATSPPMGMVAVGTPGNENDNFGPLGAVNFSVDYVSAEIDKTHRIYGISPILTVVERR